MGKTPTKHTLSKLAASLVLGSSLLVAQSALADYIADGGVANDTKYRKAIAIGQGATADGVEGPIAIGGSIVGFGAAEALGQGAVAIGSSAKAKEKQTVAVGQGAQATGNQSIAIGADIIAEGTAAIIIGGDDADNTPYETWAWSETDGKVKENAGRYQTATAKGDLAVGIGSKVQAIGDGSLALGVVATSFGLESISIGAKSSTNGTNSVAIGTESASVGENSVALGAKSLAQEKSTVAIGDGAQSLSANSTVIGKGATIGLDKAGGVEIGRAHV